LNELIEAFHHSAADFWRPELRAAEALVLAAYVLEGEPLRG